MRVVSEYVRRDREKPRAECPRCLQMRVLYMPAGTCAKCSSITTADIIENEAREANAEFHRLWIGRRS